MNHTPLPWHVDGPLDDETSHVWFDIMGGGHSVAHVPLEARSALEHLSHIQNDARFIVHAVNNHQKLVEALELVCKGTEWLTEKDFDFIRSTLAEAKKGAV